MSQTFEGQDVRNADVALSPVDIFRTLVAHVRWWAIPAVACAIVAAGYSLIAPRNWRSTQALMIRPEAASFSDERLGKFSDLSEMKTLQETILELVKSQSVVKATLSEVGPPRKYRRPTQWPTPLDIEDFRRSVDMRPPGGAEFGKTEVFYLSVRNTNRDRATALAAALCRQLEQRMQQLRNQRAKSMIAEMQRTVAMADKDLATQTNRLARFEGRIGPELVELRNLHAQVSSQGGVTQQLQAIDAERRANEALHHENVRLLALLTAAEHDAQQLLATPGSLLKSQPAVAQLKEALLAAQIRTASLLGSRSEKHPFVVVARDAEELIRGQLHDEIAIAIRGLQVDVELGAQRDAALAAKWTAARERLSRLAHDRAEYSNLVASVENHTRLAEAARKNLADARARQAGALSASVISRIDGVEAGVRPVGASRRMITAAGAAAGLVLGFGIVFLFASPVAGPSTQAECAAATQTVEQPVASSTTASNVSAAMDFSLFRGMTLEQAIRSVEQRG